MELQEGIESFWSTVDRIKCTKYIDHIQSDVEWRVHFHWTSYCEWSIADAASNVDEFYIIGESIIKSMYGKAIYECSFTRKDDAKTMSTKVKIGKKNGIEIDSGINFQRLLGVNKQVRKAK